MPTQYQIENAAGITKELGDYINERQTPKCKAVIDLLIMQCKFYEPMGFELLKCAVKDCLQEMQYAKTQEIYVQSEK